MEQNKKEKTIVKVNVENNIRSWETGNADHSEGSCTHTVLIDGRQYMFRYDTEWHYKDNNTVGHDAYSYKTDGGWQPCPGKRTEEGWVSGSGANPCFIDGMEIRLGGGLSIDGKSV